MIKKLLMASVVFALYQGIAIFLLYTSSYLNVASYYTHPPSKGDIELRRLPVLFGDLVAIKILALKKAEAEALINAGDISMAAVLSSYEHSEAFSEEEAKLRAFKVAELFIVAGYDISRCENDGKSTADLLDGWGLLDKDITSFIVEKSGSNNLSECT